MVISSVPKRTRYLGLAVLATTFVVGGLSGMAVQQSRRAAPPQVAEGEALMLPDASGNLRPCPPPRERFEPLDSIGASAEQQDSIETIMDQWTPRLRTAWRRYDKVQDSLYAAWEVTGEAIRDSMQAETRAVLTAEQRAALEALYERRASLWEAMRADQDDFERRCRAARRGGDGEPRERTEEPRERTPGADTTHDSRGR